jgi:hypothetical protein
MTHDLTRNPLEPSLNLPHDTKHGTRLLASDLNPPHDTRHDTRLPVLTEVDGSISPLEELDDTTRTLGFGVRPVCIEE